MGPRTELIILLSLVSTCNIFAVKDAGESVASEIALIPSLTSSELFCAIYIVALRAYSVDFENISVKKGKVQFFVKTICNIHSLKYSIKILTDELSNDTLAIEEINKKLHKFIGRNDIILQRLEEGGYQLLRNGIVARNLSEGEKTAISLIYFFSKIQENDAVIANQIIVLDDPISSFDSNHLFNASSFIKNSTHGAKQVFVLTHNFWFFKQVRDWMVSKNKKDKNDVMQIKSHFYATRFGQISDADKTLTETHSEYQFVFKSILEFRNPDNLNPSDYFYIANSVRRLLEGFSSFKTASNSGMEGVFNLGKKYNFDQMQRDRIYYFVQKYSHLDRIESLDNTIEPLLEESLHVVNDVLALIELVDADHYKYMLKACNF